jgi:hypothetical protein
MQKDIKSDKERDTSERAGSTCPVYVHNEALALALVVP